MSIVGVGVGFFFLAVCAGLLHYGRRASSQSSVAVACGVPVLVLGRGTRLDQFYEVACRAPCRPGRVDFLVYQGRGKGDASAVSRFVMFGGDGGSLAQEAERFNRAIDEMLLFLGARAPG